MQQPTHSQLKVVTSADARAALFLVECMLLHPVRRRPDDAEKAQIGHGQVFIWLDGAKGETGLERWTDGRSWGPSRCRDDFLIYEEKAGEHRLTKSTYTARRNTHDDTGALWHLIAYYYADETNTLVDMYTHPDYKPYTSQMAPGYFVSNRKDKSRKAKEVPAAVDASHLSRYDRLVESLQNAVTPTSPASQPHYNTNNGHHGGSRSPSSHHTHSTPHVDQYESFSPRQRQSPASTASQQRRHGLSRLDTSFVDHREQNYDQRRASVEGAQSAASRHTQHDPKTYQKVLAQDYHRLPPPEMSSFGCGGGGSVVVGKVGGAMMDMDVDMEYHNGGDTRGSSGGGVSSGVYGYPPSSPSSESSPGLSPTSSGSSPIEVDDNDHDRDLLPSANHHHHHHHYHQSSRRQHQSSRSQGSIVAPTPIRASSVPSHIVGGSANHRSPATPQSVPSPHMPFVYRQAPNVQFERGGVDMMVIDGAIANADEDHVVGVHALSGSSAREGSVGAAAEGVSPSGPTRNALDETVIQAFNSQLYGFF